MPGADYTVVFDGGSLGNPGQGYGSYEIAGPDGTVAARQVQFGNDMTNNQAEFRALIAALEDLLERVGARAGALSLAVRGDSQLVIRGLTGEWRVKHPGLQPLHRQAADLLEQFRHRRPRLAPAAGIGAHVRALIGAPRQPDGIAHGNRQDPHNQGQCQSRWPVLHVMPRGGGVSDDRALPFARSAPVLGSTH